MLLDNSWIHSKDSDLRIAHQNLFIRRPDITVVSHAPSLLWSNSLYTLLLSLAFCHPRIASSLRQRDSHFVFCASFLLYSSVPLSSDIANDFFCCLQTGVLSYSPDSLVAFGTNQTCFQLPKWRLPRSRWASSLISRRQSRMPKSERT